MIKKMLRRLKRLIFNRKKEEDSEVQIGKNVDSINSYIDSGFGWLITIGDNVTITNATILAHDASTKKSLGYTKVGRVDIGDNVFIGPNCGFYTSGHPLDIELRNKGIEYAKPIKIGNNVWIGGNVVILPGVTIGDNSVIGAGSIVTKDIQENTVAVGNPCKVIKKLT